MDQAQQVVCRRTPWPRSVWATSATRTADAEEVQGGECEQQQAPLAARLALLPRLPGHTASYAIQREQASLWREDWVRGEVLNAMEHSEIVAGDHGWLCRH